MRYISLFVCVLMVSVLASLTGCSKTDGAEEVSLPNSVISSSVPDPTTQPTEMPQATSAPTSAAPAEDSAPSETENTTENTTVTTKGLRYQFSSRDITAVSKVDPAVAEAIDSTHIGLDGQAEDGWYVAFADVSVTNLTDEDQYVMLNTISIAEVEDGSSITGTICGMRYYEDGDSDSKQYFGVSIGAGETLNAHVGFQIGSMHLGRGQTAFYINPDGVSPANDNTRFLPITITYQ